MSPGCEMILDYAMLHEQGEKEKEAVIKELMDRLVRMTPQAQLETMAKMANSMAEIKKTQPTPGWIIV
jgi:hypothetical protein